MSTPLVDFCRSRQALRDETTRCKETLEDTADAKRVTVERLRDCMHRHDLRCMPIQSGTGETMYARLVPVQTRYPRFARFEDVRGHLVDMQETIEDVPRTDVPSHVLRVFLQRAKIADDRMRVTFSSTIPRSVQPCTNAPAELRRLTTDVGGALTEYEQCRQTIKSLRSNLRDASKVVENVVMPDHPVSLEMRRGDTRKVLEVSTSTSRPSTKRGIGVRRLSKIVREAARFASHDRTNFDARFMSQAEELFRAEDMECAGTKDKVLVRVRERRAR